MTDERYSIFGILWRSVVATFYLALIMWGAVNLAWMIFDWLFGDIVRHIFICD